MLYKKGGYNPPSFEETTCLNETPIIKLHSPILSDIALFGFNLGLLNYRLIKDIIIYNSSYDIV